MAPSFAQEFETANKMKIDFITTLGLTAGVLTTIAYLPQLIKTWQAESAHDLIRHIYSHASNVTGLTKLYSADLI